MDLLLVVQYSASDSNNYEEFCGWLLNVWLVNSSTAYLIGW